MKNETISIATINSGGISHQAKIDGITTVIHLGDNGKLGGDRVVIYQYGDVRVATTNGDPVWEESDHVDFAELLVYEQIDLCDS